MTALRKLASGPWSNTEVLLLVLITTTFILTAAFGELAPWTKIVVGGALTLFLAMACLWHKRQG